MYERELDEFVCVREGERASEAVLGFSTGFYFLLRGWITSSQGMNESAQHAVCLFVISISVPIS